MGWRDDPKLRAFLNPIQPDALAKGYEDIARLGVEAYKRWLTSEIEKLPLPFDDSSNKILSVYRRSVLALIERED